MLHVLRPREDVTDPKNQRVNPATSSCLKGLKMKVRAEVFATDSGRVPYQRNCQRHAFAPKLRLDRAAVGSGDLGSNSLIKFLAKVTCLALDMRRAFWLNNGTIQQHNARHIATNLENVVKSDNIKPKMTKLGG